MTPITELSTVPEFVPWAEFKARRLRWHQGEHLTAVGPTGAGKTTLINDIIERRNYVVVLATKKRDPTMDALKRKGYRVIREWIPEAHPDTTKLIFKPPFPKRASLVRYEHARQFQHLLESVFRTGGWTIVVDEARYLTDYLKLSPELELLWQQGRSLGLTVVAGTQRPVKIPLTAYDQATHLFFWRDNDETNLKRIGGLGGLDSKEIRRDVAILPLHEVLYLNTRTGERLRTKVEV